MICFAWWWLLVGAGVLLMIVGAFRAWFWYSVSQMF